MSVWPYYGTDVAYNKPSAAAEQSGFKGPQEVKTMFFEETVVPQSQPAVIRRPPPVETVQRPAVINSYPVVVKDTETVVKMDPFTTQEAMTPPMAALGVDTNGDGRANFTYVGVDMNRDGIPDALQAPQVTTVQEYKPRVFSEPVLVRRVEPRIQTVVVEEDDTFPESAWQQVVKPIGMGVASVAGGALAVVGGIAYGAVSLCRGTVGMIPLTIDTLVRPVSDGVGTACDWVDEEVFKLKPPTKHREEALNVPSYRVLRSLPSTSTAYATTYVTSRSDISSLPRVAPAPEETVVAPQQPAVSLPSMSSLNMAPVKVVGTVQQGGNVIWTGSPRSDGNAGSRSRIVLCSTEAVASSPMAAATVDNGRAHFTYVGVDMNRDGILQGPAVQETSAQSLQTYLQRPREETRVATFTVPSTQPVSPQQQHLMIQVSPQQQLLQTYQEEADRLRTQEVAYRAEVEAAAAAAMARAREAEIPRTSEFARSPNSQNHVITADGQAPYIYTGDALHIPNALQGS
jgi:hypothetical protein